MQNRAPAPASQAQAAINYIASGPAITSFEVHFVISSSRYPVAASGARENAKSGSNASKTSAVVRTVQPGVTWPPNTSPLAVDSAMCRCELLCAPSKATLPARLRISMSPAKHRGCRCRRSQKPRGSWRRVRPPRWRRASPGRGSGGWEGFAWFIFASNWRPALMACTQAAIKTLAPRR